MILVKKLKSLNPGETIVSLGSFSIASHQTINFVDHIIGVLPNRVEEDSSIYHIKLLLISTDILI